MGYGTDNHYQFDGNINISTPKLQLAIIGASNDINKVPSDINTLIRNSTYKGVGTSVEYQPDFRQAGVNKGNVAGAQITYNFKPDSKDWDNKSSLKADYYFRNLESINETDALSTTTVGNNNQIFSTNNSNSTNTSDRHRFTSSYNYYRRSHRLDINQSLNVEDGNNSSTNLRSAQNNAGQMTSTNNGNTKSNYNNKSFNLGARYYYNNYSNWKQRFKAINADYNLTVNDNNNNRTEITSFRDFLNSARNLDFNRRYQTQNKNIAQNIGFSIPNLKSLLFKDKNLSNFNFEINSKLNLNNNKSDNIIEDYKNNTYQENQYLSNRTQTNQIDFTPGFLVSKSITRNLSNRYYKSYTFKIGATQQFINQDNKSDKSFQNIKRNYSKFIPTASFNMSNNQTGNYSQNFNVTYGEALRIPSLLQLAPLTDSTNLYYLQRGNINLKEETDRSVNLYFNHYDMKKKNTLNFSLNGTVGLIDDAIVDSTYIDQQNRRNVYLTNANGSKYARLTGNIRKSLKMKTGELQLALNSSFNINKRPNYTNNAFNFSNNINTNHTLSSNYTFKDKLAIEASQTVQTSSSKQSSLGSQYKNLTLTTSLSSNYNFTKKLSVSSNISFNSNNPSLGETINFNIWNANVTYRFTKGNNAEIKFSALDILRQNQSVLNVAETNSFYTTTRNVLQQYFMATISYYPRKFGFNDKVKK